MRKLTAFPPWLVTILTLFAINTQAAPLLNGMSVHQELGRDQFIGAIYSETLTSDAANLLAATSAMRMELKITADRGITARRFSRLWIEGMAINNRSDALTAQADNMVAFTNMFKGRLYENDHIVFALTPGAGVGISANDQSLGTITDDSFFSLLLSTWIGRVPLSSTFRERLLVAGDVSGDLIARYDAITPSADRIAQVRQWNTPEPAAQPADPAPAAAAVTEAETSAPAIAAAPRIELPPPDLAGSPAASPGVQSEPAPSNASSSAASVAASSSSSSAVAAAPEAIEEEDEDYVPIFTAESLLASQRYFSNLNRQIQTNITYPRRAAQRGQTGSMRIAITLDRSGNLLNAKMLEESEHSTLNKEAMDTVEDQSPYPPIPDVIRGQTHEFTIPITFTLQPR